MMLMLLYELLCYDWATMVMMSLRDTVRWGEPLYTLVRNTALERYAVVWYVLLCMR